MRYIVVLFCFLLINLSFGLSTYNSSELSSECAISAFAGAPSFTDGSGNKLENKLMVNTLVNLEFSAQIKNAELYLYLDRDGEIEVSPQIDFIKSKSLFGDIFKLAESFPLTTAGLQQFFILRLHELKVSDRIKIVVKSGDNNYESDWYSIDQSIKFNNFRFVKDRDDNLSRDIDRSEHATYNRDQSDLYDGWDRQYYASLSKVNDIEDPHVNLRLVLDASFRNSFENTEYGDTYASERLYNKYLPKSIDVMLSVYEDRFTNLEQNISVKLNFIQGWKGKKAIYFAEIYLPSLFKTEIKNGYEIRAELLKESKVSLTTSVLINSDKEETIDCSFDMLGKNGASVDFIAYAKASDKSSDKGSFKQVYDIRVDQDFYIEVSIKNKKQTCLSGWVELLEYDRTEKKILNRTRVDVYAIQDVGSSTFDKYRSGPLKLSYEGGAGSIKVNEVDKYNKNELHMAASEEELKLLETKGNTSKEYNVSSKNILEPLQEGNGYMDVVVKGRYKLLGDIPKGQLIIINSEKKELINESIRQWEGELPEGVYKVEYDIMGERFGKDSIVIDSEVDRNVSIETKGQLGSAKMVPNLEKIPGNSEDIQRLNYKLLTGFMVNYSRNNQNQISSWHYEILHKGDYKANIEMLTGNYQGGISFFEPKPSNIKVLADKTTEWPSPIGILVLNKAKEADGSTIRSAATITGEQGTSPLFAFSEITAKILPVGKYSIEIQKANTSEKIKKGFEIKPSKITYVDTDIEEPRGQLNMRAINENDDDLEYFVRIRKDDKHVKSIDGKNLTETLPVGNYELKFLVEDQDITRNVEITEDKLSKVLIKLGEPETEEENEPNEEAPETSDKTAKVSFDQAKNWIGHWISSVGDLDITLVSGKLNIICHGSLGITIDPKSVTADVITGEYTTRINTTGEFKWELYKLPQPDHSGRQIHFKGVRSNTVGEPLNRPWNGNKNR